MRMKLFSLSVNWVLWVIVTIGEVYYGFHREMVLEFFDYIQKNEDDRNEYVNYTVNRIIEKKRKKYERKLNKRKES